MGLGTQEFKKYLKISQGKIRLEVAEGTEGAEKREVTNPTTNEKKTKHELCWNYIVGKIKSIEFRESPQYGNSWSMEIDDGKESFNLQWNDSTRHCDDILGRLPNLDFNEEVKISTYPAGKTKKATGVAMFQGKEKIPNYFVAYVGEGDDVKKVTKNGYPEANDKMDKDDYKIYMIQVRKFLKKYTLDKVIPNLEVDLPSSVAVEDDLPF